MERKRGSNVLLGRRNHHHQPLISCSLKKCICALLFFCGCYVQFLLQWAKNNYQISNTSSDDGSKIQIHVENNLKYLKTIGFATTLTGCPRDDTYTDGAAVLKHSIHLASIHGNKGGQYDYKLYVFYHPDAENCTLPLADLGYTLLPRNTPINVSDIRGDVLRERIVNNGCCGEKELIKLYAFTLIQHAIVVHIDLDAVVLKPMDAVFDLMLGNHSSSLSLPGTPLMWPDRPLPKQIDIFYTKDYNIVPPRRKNKPTQGGLLIIRPNKTVYEEFIDIVLEGDYYVRGGWGKKFGPFYGGMTIQGLIPYYFEYLHPGNGVELNRCIYNQMTDNPTDQQSVNDTAQGSCRTGQEVCEDCRKRPLEEVVTAHFTICQKPWNCFPYKQNNVQMRLCRQLVHEWFRLRSNLEKSWGRNGTGLGTYDKDHYFGYCYRYGEYQPIEKPYRGTI